MKTKICSTCKIRKPISEFTKKSKNEDGLNCQCKECVKKYRERTKDRDKEWREKNKEKLKKKSKKYYLDNKEKIKARVKKYVEENKEAKKQADREYLLKNREKLLQYKKNYYRENKKRLLMAHKEWEKKNKNKINLNQRLKRKNNKSFQLLRALRNRMYDVLKGRTKSDTTKNLLGCSIEDFKKHLEKQFKPGMTWDNYGRKGWHIDHIKPCAKFDFSKESEQRKCFNYTNLQPLWWHENLSKGKK